MEPELACKPPLSVAPAAFGYPINQSNYTFTGGNSIYYVNPTLVTPYTTNWNLGIQREVPGHTVIEVRYLGNTIAPSGMWHYQNINEGANIFENGIPAAIRRRRTT